MRDAEHGLAVMPAREVEQGRDDPSTHFVVGFALVPAPTEAEPAPVLLRKAPLDLFAGEALPFPDVDLAQARVWDQAKPSS